MSLYEGHGCPGHVSCIRTGGVLILEISLRVAIVFSGNAGCMRPPINQLVRRVRISQPTVLEGAISALCLDQRVGYELGALQITHPTSRKKCQKSESLIVGLSAVRFSALFTIRWKVTLNETRLVRPMQIHLRFEEVKRSIDGFLPGIDVSNGAALFATSRSAAVTGRRHKRPRNQEESEP